MSDDDYDTIRNEVERDDEYADEEEEEVMDVVEEQEIMGAAAAAATSGAAAAAEPSNEDEDYFLEAEFIAEEEGDEDDEDEEHEGRGEGEDEEEGEGEERLVAGARQFEQTSGRILSSSDYERKFNAAAESCKSNGIISEDQINIIKEKIFGRTDEFFRVQFKNPIGLILGYIMYNKIDVNRRDSREAFLQTKALLSRLFAIARKARVGKKKKKDDDELPLASIRDIDIIRYYTFWKKSVMRR